MKTDVYQKVTDTIVAQLEQGVRPVVPALERRACGRQVVRGNQDEKAYCHRRMFPDVERCLNTRVPVASLISARATAPLFLDYIMLTDVGLVDLPMRLDDAAASPTTPQGSLHRNPRNRRGSTCRPHVQS